MSANTPNFVLLPGMHGTADLFDPLRTVAPHELSAISYEPDAPTSYDELVPWVVAKLPDSPYVLIAESYSVPLAIRIAASNPSGLRALVLCGGFVRSPRRFLGLVPWRLLFRIRAPRWVLRRFLVGPDAPPALCQSVRVAARASSPRRMAQRMREIRRCDVRAAFASLEQPLLWLHGAADRLVRPITPTPAPPQLVLERMGGPHLLLQARPEACWRAIERFLRSIGADDR